MSRDACQRSRSDAELAFLVMRSLAAARLLWADRAALPLEAIASLVDAAPQEIARAVSLLCEEGVAELRTDDAAVRLTACVAGEIAARRPVAARWLN